MDSIFYFNAKKDCSGHRYDVLCAYLGDKGWQDSTSFYAALEKALKSSDTLPDCIVVYVPTVRLRDCFLYWENKELHNSFTNRLSKKNVCYTKSLFFVELAGEKFNVHPRHTIKNTSLEINDYDAKRFYSFGLSKLADESPRMA